MLIDGHQEVQLVPLLICSVAREQPQPFAASASCFSSGASRCTLPRVDASSIVQLQQPHLRVPLRTGLAGHDIPHPRLLFAPPPFWRTGQFTHY